MALKSSLDTLDEVHEALHEHYVEKDGKFVLQAEGLVPRERVSEFRTNNLSLTRELEEIKARYDGIDPEKHRELADRAQRERDGKLIAAGKVDELVNERVAAMKVGYDKQIDELTGKLTGSTKQLESLVIDSAIRDAAAKAGVRVTATEDVLLRGRTMFRLQDGKAVPMDGDKPIYGKSGDPMQISEWVATLTESAPHLFEPSQGGGSRSGSGAAPSVAGRIDRGDTKGFLANLDKIASGKMAVG